MNLPTDLLYTKDHEWLRVDGDVATVGITELASEALGDVVFVDLADAGSAVTAGESCGEIESTKSVSDLYAPTDGEVLEVNDAVVQDPSLVNTDPYGAGWLLRLRVASPDGLLDADAYARLAEQG
ncbi:glycine cleavage system protein GcvH [Phycicoccus sp. MAQZ13P-2]|uniref:glycine cleavage system protein GcvH n=1 Tax=Phycicoccus mangrovi TaxID=2840470 RepID=UPI001C006795|nr:glycine cleavage system protein GcvH [Phycicoccus mangrovi]MBT9257205.1 glycine cleavage system protein GcvH [Phycicoccus mangrovi]MBT9276142.1 glycine cleavage system protein GcvH [Phycicoccus mangrovi]